MFKPLRTNYPLMKIINNSLIDLPTPSNISSMWNFGSILGLCLGTQIVTGIFLAMHYSSEINTAFTSVIEISRNINYGWMLRVLHANGASMFFICMYIHVMRGMYYGSYKLMNTWIMGMIILFATMATAFLGYVLPWGQMSFWGATVITNLISAIPYVGNSIVQWVWGGYAVDMPTLMRFFSLHFMLPFLILGMVIIHLLFLHQSGSSNPLGLKMNIDKMSFHPYFSLKDLVGFMIMFIVLIMIMLMKPYMLSDPDNFIPANPLVTPIHIQPEWYFLFAYAILRSIPNKLGGVIMLVLSISILFILMLTQKKMIKNNQFLMMNKMLFWYQLNILILLTWLGAQPVEDPFIIMSQLMTILYFSYFLINPLIMKKWINLIINN